MNCDCHIHMVLDSIYFKDAIESHQNGVREELVRARLQTYADAGITYLRDGGDSSGVALFARNIAGEYGIEYAAPAFPIHKIGRYGDFIGRGYRTESEYVALLDEAERLGADFVKIMFAGIMDFDVYEKLSCEPLEDEEMKLLVKHAHDRGLAVMAHVNGDAAVRAAILAGTDSIEHANFMEPDTLKLLSESDTVWTPTLAPIANIIDSGRFSRDVLQRLKERQTRAIAEASSLGAYIALGSDAGAWEVPHAQGAADELAHLRVALGEGTEVVLAIGSARIKEKFRRMR